MPIEIGLWRLSETPERLEFSRIETESRLEQMLAKDISILNPNLLLIGRQIGTAYGKLIDLLALDNDAHLVVIELKRDRTPREVVAQLLDYGSWVRSLEDDAIAAIFEQYTEKYYPDRKGKSLDEAFCEAFDVTEMPETLNESHELIVVAAELDDSTERIIKYLSEEYGVAINATFFRFFQDGEKEYLTRAWLVDPAQVDVQVEDKREKAPWNGEFYVSYGLGENRDWEEARKYGFISGGGGSWYSGTLRKLKKNARVWVNIPRVGYVGVGEVIDDVVPVDSFMVQDDAGTQVPITSLPLKAAKHATAAQNEDKAEYFVRVKWMRTVSAREAVKEKGFFGNQNTVATPRAKKWVHTVERLKKRFGIDE